MHHTPPLHILETCVSFTYVINFLGNYSIHVFFPEITFSIYESFLLAKILRSWYRIYFNWPKSKFSFAKFQRYWKLQFGTLNLKPDFLLKLIGILLIVVLRTGIWASLVTRLDQYFFLFIYLFIYTKRQLALWTCMFVFWHFDWLTTVFEYVWWYVDSSWNQGHL